MATLSRSRTLKSRCGLNMYRNRKDDSLILQQEPGIVPGSQVVRLGTDTFDERSLKTIRNEVEDGGNGGALLRVDSTPLVIS